MFRQVRGLWNVTSSTYHAHVFLPTNRTNQERKRLFADWDRLKELETQNMEMRERLSGQMEKQNRLKRKKAERDYLLRTLKDQESRIDYAFNVNQNGKNFLPLSVRPGLNSFSLFRTESASLLALEEETKERRKELAIATQNIKNIQQEMNRQYPPALQKRNLELDRAESQLCLARQKQVEKLISIVSLMPREENPDEMRLLNAFLPISGDYHNLMNAKKDSGPSLLAASLGLVAQLVHLVSICVDVPLLYPVLPGGSLSHVLFRGSKLPLYGTTFTDDFKKAIVLLNSNVRHLCFMQGLLLENPEQVLVHLWTLAHSSNLGREPPFESYETSAARFSSPTPSGSHPIGVDDEWVTVNE